MPAAGTTSGAAARPRRGVGTGAAGLAEGVAAVGRDAAARDARALPAQAGCLPASLGDTGAARSAGRAVAGSRSARESACIIGAKRSAVRRARVGALRGGAVTRVVEAIRETEDRTAVGGDANSGGCRKHRRRLCGCRPGCTRSRERRWLRCSYQPTRGRFLRRRRRGRQCCRPREWIHPRAPSHHRRWRHRKAFHRLRAWGPR